MWCCAVHGPFTGTHPQSISDGHEADGGREYEVELIEAPEDVPTVVTMVTRGARAQNIAHEIGVDRVVLGFSGVGGEGSVDGVDCCEDSAIGGPWPMRLTAGIRLWSMI